jgi:hypothetical protein
MFTLSMKEIITASVIVLIIGFNAWEKYHEYRKRKTYSLAANPDRCQDHELRLRSIEKDCGEIKTNVAVLVTKVDSLDDRLDNIGEIFSATGGIKP